MSNIISEWKTHSKNKRGSVAEGVRRLNSLCGTSIQQGGIDLMEQGKRNIPVCVHRMMLGEILIDSLINSGIKVSDSDMSINGFLELTDKLSPPLRV